MNKEVRSKISSNQQFSDNEHIKHWFENTNNSLDGRVLVGVFSTLFAYRWSILFLFILGCVTGVLKAINENPVYRANLTMLVEPSSAQVSGQFQLFNPFNLRFYETQYEMLRSRTVASKVVENLDLVNREGLSKTLVPPSLSQKIKSSISRWPLVKKLVSSEELPIGQFDELAVTEQQRIQKYNWLVSVIQGGVRIAGTKESQLVQVSFSSRDPKFAAEIANELVDAYIDTGIESQLLQSERASAWLVKRLEQVRSNLTGSEKELQEYLLSKDSVDLKQTRAISSQELSALNQEYISARAKFDELSKRYGSKHPRISEARSELSAARSRYNRASKGVGGSKQKEFELSKLERDIEVNQQLYDLFLTKFRETDLSTGDQLSSARIVDKALPPSSPIHPNAQKIMFLWGLGGLVLGVILAFLRDQLDTTFKDPQQLERQMGSPLLGVIPEISRSKSIIEREYLKGSLSPFTESINHIRTGVVYSDVDNPPNVILVTSSVKGEGKTTTSSNLALSYAQIGKTLLIDADLRRPRVHKVSNVTSSNGLVNLVAGVATMDECIAHDKDEENLHILVAGDTPPNPLELLSSVKMRKTLEELEEQYDYIVIDAAPILPASDALVLGQLADAVIMVVKAESTHSHLPQDSMKRLHSANVEVTGLVFSQANVSKIKSYRYGGYYGGYYQTPDDQNA